MAQTPTPETFACPAGGPAHPAHRDFCQTCEPSATARDMETCCQSPAPTDSDWTCRCGHVLCLGGHTHTWRTGEECARC